MAKQLKTMSGYDCRNKWVLRFRRNVVSDGADWTSTGRLFQIGGLAAANERSPTVTSRDGRTSRRLEVDECMALFAGSAFHSVAAGGDGRAQSFLSLVTLTFDLWPWHSNSIQARDRTRVFPVNLAQIRSAVPRDIWFTNKTKNKKITDRAKNRTCVW